MHDRHKYSLQDFYHQSISKAKEYLKSRFSIEPCERNDVDYPVNLPKESWIVWKIQVETKIRNLTYLIAVPDIFPDALPKIYLSKQDYSDISPIPHIDQYRFICTRDPQVVSINEDQPGEAIEELIKIATNEIILKGLSRENLSDFVTEFSAYWNEEGAYKILSLFNPGSTIEELILFHLKEDLLGSKYIVAPTEEHVRKWLSNLDMEPDSDEMYAAIYLPLKEPVTPPKSNADYYRIIKSSGILKNYSQSGYFMRNQSSFFILFSFPLKGNRVLAAWEQQNLKTLSGFRPCKIPVKNKMMASKIRRLKVERIDKQRIFNRGGVGLNSIIDQKSIGIIGCGSLGSTLAISLSKAGISRFSLIDNEPIEIENVARHECGFLEASKQLYKTTAVMKKLTQHFPHIQCEEYHDDILNLLKNDESALDELDICIVSIASLSVERRLNTLLRHSIINCPLIFIWIEPYGVAGQILYDHSSNGGCYECCMNYNGDFRYSVAKPNETFFKRESGCQSTFIQYSNLEIQHFLSVACKKTLTFLENPPQTSLLVTWIGDLSYFKSLGYEINDRWYADSSYSIHEISIPKNTNCMIC